MSLRSRVSGPLSAVLLGLLVATSAAMGPVPSATADDLAPVQERPRAGDADLDGPAVFQRSSYLCLGYQACRAAGMGNAGYASNSQRMYWRMYSGHNCTNYAAYRMVKSGLPNERPWSGGGNATYWGTSMSSITDATPRVGAVAWWRANTGPAGSSGHVAYVERVVSADEIVISQDSWGGDFSWAVVTRASGNWPSGFVHFNDKPLRNTEAPVLSGTAKVGAVLTATPGAWKPSSVDVAYEWLADGRPIAGATSSTLKLTRARLDQQIAVRTTARQVGYPTRTATSAAVGPVQPGQLKNTVAPQISGVPEVDAQLRVDPGTWTPEPTLAIQWLADGVPIPGATGSTLTLGPDLVARTITVEVTASRTGYAPVRVQSPATAPVAPGRFVVSTAPSLRGAARLGETLGVDRGAFAPADAGVQVELQWLRDGAPVPGATGATYSVTNVDLGSRISARVTLSRPGYVTTTLETPRSEVVRSDPRIRVQTTQGPRRVKVTVTVAAPGVAEVDGPVVVRLAGVSRQLVLRHGTAKVALAGIKPGKRTLTVRYAGSDVVNRLIVTRTVRVR